MSSVNDTVPDATADESGLAAGTVIRFRYTNWRDVDHEYVVRVEGMSRGISFSDGRATRDPDTLFLHGDVVERDGDARPEMGNARRRSFERDGMRQVSIVECAS